MNKTDELATLLDERIREIARAVFQEAARDLTGQTDLTDGDGPAKLREQLARIKAKERVTVKEAALLLSCSESHVRKLVRLARKGKSHRPIPFVDMEGVTVFPFSELSEWASPEPKRQATSINKEAA
ncbi:MAG TPA: helix-turn-helix domain-containing protein [Pyrinomonadaceae bacterium]|jgi:hypothetical protein|nr:helix-turn-helix domain-containing protein [Pyrinomonadaceae bacterium]